MCFWKPSVNALAAIKSLEEEPENWEIGQHVLHRKTDGLKIWTSNGLGSYEVHPSGNKFNWAGQYAFHRARQRFEAWKILEGSSKI